MKKTHVVVKQTGRKANTCRRFLFITRQDPDLLSKTVISLRGVIKIIFQNHIDYQTFFSDIGNYLQHIDVALTKRCIKYNGIVKMAANI